MEEFLSRSGCISKSWHAFFDDSGKETDKKASCNLLHAWRRVLIEDSRKESATGGKMDSHDGGARFPLREPPLDLRGTPRAIITAGG
jgi:hypothetical protein